MMYEKEERVGKVKCEVSVPFQLSQVVAPVFLMCDVCIGLLVMMLLCITVESFVSLQSLRVR